MNKPDWCDKETWGIASDISMDTANSHIGNTLAVASAILKSRQDALEEAGMLAFDIASKNAGFSDGPGALAAFNAIRSLSQPQKAEQE